jgi:hypothetical protein
MINKKMDTLNTKIDKANKDALYLKALNGSIFKSVGKTESGEVVLEPFQLEFADSAPKDFYGNPIPTPRVTSLTLGITSKSGSIGSKYGDSATNIELDESATDEQKLRSKQAEETIDKNLDYVRKGVGNLKNVAVSLGMELDRQSQVVEKIDTKADMSTEKVDILNRRVNGILIINKAY